MSSSGYTSGFLSSAAARSLDQELSHRTLKRERLDDLLQFDEDDRLPRQRVFAVGDSGGVIWGVRDKDAADLATSVHADEVAGYVPATERLIPPLHLDEVHPAVQLDRSVDLLDGAIRVVVPYLERFPDEDLLRFEETVEDELEGLPPAVRVLLAEEREEVGLHLLALRALGLPLGVLRPLGVAVTLELSLTFLLNPSEAVFLVDQLRHRRDRTARFQLIVRVAGREVVEFRYALENLASLLQPAVAQLVDVRQDLAGDVVLAERRLVGDASLGVGEERAIDATSPEEENNVALTAGEQRHRVDDGVEDIGRVVERKVRRHWSLSTSRSTVVRAQ